MCGELTAQEFIDEYTGALLEVVKNGHELRHSKGSWNSGAKQKRQ
jgi:hypothetical protein